MQLSCLPASCRSALARPDFNFAGRELTGRSIVSHHLTSQTRTIVPTDVSQVAPSPQLSWFFLSHPFPRPIPVPISCFPCKTMIIFDLTPTVRLRCLHGALVGAVDNRNHKKLSQKGQLRGQRPATNTTVLTGTSQ